MNKSGKALMKSANSFSFFPLLLLAVFLSSGPVCFAQLRVRVSVKLLYNNSNPNNPIPPGGDVQAPFGAVDTNHCGDLPDSAISCDTEILEKFEYVNRIMDRFGRGYRFDPIEIIHLTNPPPAVVNGGSITTQVWTLNSLVGDVNLIQNPLTVAALTNTNFQYRSNAINFYVFNNPDGGYGDNLVTGIDNSVCVTSQSERGSWPRFLHEMGHYLGLYHTFGTGTNIVTDQVCDTVQDFGASSVTLDQLSQTNFAANFLDLSDQQKEAILDVFYNIMSYHADNGQVYNGPAFDPDSISLTTTNTDQKIRHRLTRDQLDRISNRFNNLATIGVVSGRTVFVMKSYNPCESVSAGAPITCGCDQAPRTIEGNTNTPPSTIADGLRLTGTNVNHDVLLVRGGIYAENLTINQRVSIRATRGTVRIGQ